MSQLSNLIGQLGCNNSSYYTMRIAIVTSVSVREMAENEATVSDTEH